MPSRFDKVEFEGVLGQATSELVEMLAKMAERLLQTRTFEQAMHTLLDDVIAFHGAKCGNVQLPTGDMLVIAAQRGFSADFLESFRRVVANDGCACGRALRTGQPIIVADVEQDPDFSPFREVARRAGFRSVQSMPLTLRSGQLVAVVSTHFAEPERPSQKRIEALRLYRIMAAEQAYILLGDAALAQKAVEMNNELYGDVRFRSHDRYATGTVPSSKGLFRMDDRTQYHEFAAQCERFAADAQTEQHRKFFREMADAWRRLADETKEAD